LNEENQINYYAIIPATVRYDKNLKSSEKLMYSEITALTNKSGYCFANNRYFANLYDVSIHTVSQWISHLEKLGYIIIELIRDDKKEIKERRIYINDISYVQKNTYPYVFKSTYPMYKNVQDNNIKYNIDEDNLFNYIINNSNKIQSKFYDILYKLELIYTEEMLHIMQKDKIQMLKEIIYILYEIYNSKFNSLLSQVNRESLINLYILVQEHSPNDFLNYYKRTIINKYTNNST